MTPSVTARRSAAMAAAIAIAMVLVGALGASPAAADTAPINPADPTTPATVSADGLPTVQIDGVVWSQVVVGNTVYAAGSFQTARPAGAAPGVNTVARHNLLAFDIVTGNLIDSFAPDLNGQALSITASPDGTRIYVVGDFTQVNGKWRVRAAAFDTATGQLVSSFAPTLASSARAVAATNDTVYIGGAFTSAASVTGGTLVPRAYLAAFSATTGALTPFVADANAAVNALAVTADGAKVVVAGNFTVLSGASTYGLWAVSPVTGAPIAFPANRYIRDAGPNSSITSLYADASGIYGAAYTYGAGGSLEGAFRADPTTGALLWTEDCHGDSYSIFPQGGAIYVANHAHYCGNFGGFPQTTPTTHHHALAFSKAVTGVISADIYGYASHGGEPAPTLLNWFPDFDIGTYTGQNQAAWSVTGNASYVVYGGEFPSMNGTAQQGLVRFANPSIAPNTQGPRITGANFNPSVISINPGEVRVMFGTNWDRDNATLTYRLYRGTEKSTPIYTEAITSTFWKVLSRTVVDAGLPPGSTQSYLLSATDPFGNVVKSQWVATTVSGTSLGAYPRAVLGDSPTDYWRLGDATGSSLLNWAGYPALAVGTGITGGAAGPVTADANTASTFVGNSNGIASMSTPQQGPNTFTLEAWVKTTSTKGGKIIGFGDADLGVSPITDRHLYMDNAGHIWFGVRPASLLTVSSAASYNDGTWHYVVASLGSNGMRLYVDAKLVAQRTDATAGKLYQGYWRVGGDNLSGWNNQPTSNFLAGVIGEVAVYPAVLSPLQVIAHYVASGRTSPYPPAPADAYGAAVYQAAPTLYWRVGEASGTTAADVTPNGNPGTYQSGVTLGAAGAIVGTADTAVTFNGSSGLLSSNTQFTDPTTYSEELWFATTTTNGGKLIGFGDQQKTLSNTYDRHVYMGNDGRLTFGSGTASTITSSGAYNDGAWHHMVATQSSAGMVLYVDGVVVGTNPQTVPQNYSGYWKVGGDRTGGPQPYFAGTIDEVAVYPTALDAQTVAAHYSLGSTGQRPNQAPTASFTPTVTNLTVQVDGSASVDPDGTIAGYAWNFGDGATATGATASHVYLTSGTRTVTLTVTDNRGGTGTVSHDVTVTAPPANQAPTAAFTPTLSGLQVQVDGSASADPDGSIAGYAWDFGDGATGTGVSASHTYAAVGDYVVTLTVTDNQGATGTVTHEVTWPPGPVPLATDTFTRAVATGWGSAETGGAWSTVGPAANYSVTAGAGTQTMTTAGSTVATSLGVSSASTDLAVTVSLDKAATGGAYVSFQGRKIATGDYRGKLHFYPTGAVTLGVSRMVGTTETVLQTATVPGLTYSPGDQLRVRVDVTGTSPTTVAAKVWRAGAAEPAAWLVSSTDSTAALQAPGGIGLISYLTGTSTNAPVVARFDDLAASIVP